MFSMKPLPTALEIQGIHVIFHVCSGSALLLRVTHLLLTPHSAVELIGLS